MSKIVNIDKLNKEVTKYAKSILRDVVGVTCISFRIEQPYVYTYHPIVKGNMLYAQTNNDMTCFDHIIKAEYDEDSNKIYFTHYKRSDPISSVSLN